MKTTQIFYTIKHFLFLGTGLLFSIQSSATGLDLTEKELKNPPPRIIRTCCSFGSEVKVAMIPGMKVTDISCPDDLGKHKYLGDKEEGNGIIYTRKGGFIDMGHLRDQADWTAYLFELIQHQNKGKWMQPLGHEGGMKKLYLQIPDDINEFDAMQLSGKIAYDLSVWHEIATWFGASYIPLLPERYSSFSIEDAYSNLLGVTIGIQALQSELPFEEAMTFLIDSTLTDLGAVTEVEEIYQAMEAVREIWWTREKKLPSRKVLLQRELQVYPKVQPWLVPGWAAEDPQAYVLEVPQETYNEQPLSDMYHLEIRLNHKFPFKRMFPYRKKRRVSQLDFDTMIEEVERRLEKDFRS